MAARSGGGGGLFFCTESQRMHDDLDAAILASPFVGVVAGDGLILSPSPGDHLLGVHAVSRQIVA